MQLSGGQLLVTGWAVTASFREPRPGSPEVSVREKAMKRAGVSPSAPFGCWQISGLRLIVGPGVGLTVARIISEAMASIMGKKYHPWL